jgi:hypothetical protein
MSEGLQRMMADLSFMKSLPDADLEFLVDLETTILQKLREPIDSMANQMGPAGAVAPGGGAPTGPGAPPPMPVTMSPPGGGVAGLRQEAPMPNPDELRRMLNA